MTQVFRRMPIQIEAIQFTGDNWAEMHDFTGHMERGGQQTDIFVGPGPGFPFLEGHADAALLYPNGEWQVVTVGDWIIKQAEGFGLLEDHEFQATHIDEEEFKDFSGLNTSLGDIPVLDASAGDARMLARVRLSLILNRPMSEVDAITERLSWIIANYRVGVEEGAYKTLDKTEAELVEQTVMLALIETGFEEDLAQVATKAIMERNILRNEFHDEDTLDKVYKALIRGAQETSGEVDAREWAIGLVSSMQNEGILFRERFHTQ